MMYTTRRYNQAHGSIQFCSQTFSATATWISVSASCERELILQRQSSGYLGSQRDFVINRASIKVS